MKTNVRENNDLVFGLDIGTRSIVGVVGYMERNRFCVAAMAVKQHETRAMIDGQIHDIYKVGDTIRKVKNELEKQLDTQLSDVCIAAAGRVLRTISSDAVMSFDEDTRVNSEHIYSLNLLAVEKAHSEINIPGSKERFYCVGNTPVTYKLNGYDISNLEGHKAMDIGVELIATFLPEEVVDSLYEAVEYAGLNVASLTLEPIAAMNIAIPEQYRLLNIGLVDVGAGTSDICLTKDGSVIAYGMIPVAGDEITEIIAKNYLVDFNTAEQIKVDASAAPEGEVTFKDIMGLEMTVKSSDVAAVTQEIIENMAKATADKIIELNGGRPVNAVFVVGGGGKMTGYTQAVAENLGIVKERVAVRGEEVLTSVDFMVDTYRKDSLFVTPVGICTNYYAQKNSFVFVNINNERIKMYDNNHLTVVDAVMQIGFPNEKLFPRRGPELNFTVNGKTRLVRGVAGEGAVVKVNGRPANLNSPIEQNDVIEVTESTVGPEASITIGHLDEFKSTISFNVDGKNIQCPKFAYVNGELKSEFYEINSGDVVSMENYYTVEQLFAFLDYDISDLDIYVNNEIADMNTKVYENFTVRTLHKSYETLEPVQTEKFEKDVQSFKMEKAVQSDVSEETGESLASEENVQSVSLENQGVRDMVVLINKEPVRLRGKQKYILVDIFDFYPFDLSKPQGRSVVLRCNGENCEYTAPLKDGDVIDLYWEEF